MPEITVKELEQVCEQLTNIEKKMKDEGDNIRKSGEALQTEVKNLGTASSETKKAVDDALLKHGELVEEHKKIAGRLTEVEQHLAGQRENRDDVEPATLGSNFVEHKDVKEKMSSAFRGSLKVSMSRKDILNLPGTVGSVTSPANSLVGTLRVPGIVTPPERRLTVRDLLAPGTTNQGNVEYVRETGYTNNAAVVTEGGTKPQSELTFELAHAPVRTIAHIFKASRQIMDDAPALRSYIDMRARYGLRLEEEDELLNGDGTGIHLNGLLPQATAFNAQFTVEAKQRMDTIRLAILQVFLAEFPASGIVLHPNDWAAIQLTKDSQERYIIGNPQDGNPPRLWNLPVVETQSMSATEFLVGAFNMAAQIFDRMDIEVLLSTEDGDNFVKNMITLRAEERLALAVYRPEALVTGDFDLAT